MVKEQRSGLHLASSDCRIIFYIVSQEECSRDRRLLPRVMASFLFYIEEPYNFVMQVKG